MRLPWWQTGVVYHIYPRSLMDSNGDGVGDLPGILRRLDHLVELGVDALWLSPAYPSPMADFGCDVADYTDIDPLFGTLTDFDALLAGAHARGLRVIMDFVANHTSDQHPWFRASRASRNDAQRDWYIWRDPAPAGGPPNNWLSEFGGPAWTFDARTGQYYLHTYLREQPNLNWRNPEVERAMLAVLCFWLERGVDGFRLDAIPHLYKDAGGEARLAALFEDVATPDERVAAVRYLRFAIPEAARGELASGQSELALEVDHPACRCTIALAADVRAELLADLSADAEPAAAVASGAALT